MGAQIDMSNDRANMAYVGAIPWQGMGQPLEAGASIDEWSKAAGLDWTVDLRPSYYKTHPDKDKGSPAWTYTEAPNAFHVVRSDTEESLSVMTSRYKPVQPAECLEFFRDFVETDDRFTIETAGSLNGGRRIWALARFTPGEEMMIGGDAHGGYLMMATSYNGTLSTVAQPTLTRVVCTNTMGVAMAEGRRKRSQVKVPHSVLWTPEVRRDAQDRLAVIVSGFSEYKLLGDALAAFKMSRDETERFLKGVVYGEKKEGKEARGVTRDRLANQYDSLFNSWLATAQETEGDTAWAALQAVTRFVDHGRNTRMTGGNDSPEAARMSSAFFGSGATLKSKAVTDLIDMAKVDIDAIIEKAHEKDPVLLAAE